MLSSFSVSSNGGAENLVTFYSPSQYKILHSCIDAEASFHRAILEKAWLIQYFLD